MTSLFATKQNQKSGFTLVELLVAMGVFVVVVMFTMGSVLGILDAGRKSKAITAVMTNLNFTLEVMSREIKFGSKYYCGTEITPFVGSRNCGTGEDTISFVAPDGSETVYKLSNNQILKSVNSGSTFVAVTAPDIVIQNLKFFVYNSYPQSACATNPSDPVICDHAQPKVIILVQGYAGQKPSIQSSFSIQTTVSQRTLDLDSLPSGGGGSPSQTAYRYVRWTVNQRKCVDNSIQVAEFTLLQNGAVVPWPSGTVATNPGGSNPGSETPDKIIDGNKNSKLLDFNFASNGYSQISIDTGIGNSVTFNGYQWTTANDEVCRDPSGWSISASNDGVVFLPVLGSLTNQTNPAVPDARNTDTSIFTIP